MRPTINKPRPRAGFGLASAVRDGDVTKRNASAKPVRNRNRVASAAPAPVARRPKK